VLACFLVGGRKYEFTLIGWIDGGIEGNASREVIINDRPKVGFCKAEPRKGEPLDPKFTLSCTKFTDTETPLQYEFFYRREKTLETLGSGLEASRSRVTFPSGQEIVLYAKVSDSLGASSMVEFNSSIEVIHVWKWTEHKHSHITVMGCS